MKALEQNEQQYKSERTHLRQLAGKATSVAGVQIRAVVAQSSLMPCHRREPKPHCISASLQPLVVSASRERQPQTIRGRDWTFKVPELQRAMLVVMVSVV